MIVVVRAPPYLTVQDSGRFGYRASGVPPAGAMDQWSFVAANICAGNQLNAAALEWAIGGGVLKFSSDCIVGLEGAEIDAVIDEKPVAPGEPIEIRAGQSLNVRRIVTRRFLYLAVRGGIDCPIVLGSQSTYVPAAFGGVEGRRLRAGDILRLGGAASQPMHRGQRKELWEKGAPDYDASTVRIVPHLPDDIANGNDAELFAQVVKRTYTVSAASDRMGYRLETDEPLDGSRASVTSEPVCAGTIQLTPSGQPIVLMADAPTIGGYRIIGAVISFDLPIIAQSLPGRTLRFEAISVGDAQALLAERERALSKLVTAESA